MTDSRELSDEELELIAAGGGVMWRRLVTGALVATMVATSLPMRAMAAETEGSGGAPAAQEQVLGGSLGAATMPESMLTSAPDSAPADYTANFSMADIATPEGVTLSEQGIQAAAGAPAAAVPSVTDATPEVDYSPDALYYVDDSAKNVSSFGAGLFNIIKSAHEGDYVEAFGGGAEILRLLGIIADADPGVTNEQILDEVKKLETLVQSMSTKLDETTKQTYQNRLVVFDNALGVLAIDCATAQDMFKKGAELPSVKKLKKEDPNYTKRLVEAMETAEKDGNGDFKGFTKLMEDIETSFKLVAVECAKPEGASPFHAFDSYWSLYFNFETQGYYLRQAYRTNAEWQLKQSHALLAAYYDISSSPVDTHKALTDALGDALRGIDAIPAGKSPEDIVKSTHGLAGKDFNFRVPWTSAGVEIGRSLVTTTGSGYHNISDDKMKEFCNRLHGRTVAEDLRLAGLMADYDPKWNELIKSKGLKEVKPEDYVGLAYREGEESFHWVYLPFDATSFTPKEYRTSDKREVVAPLVLELQVYAEEMPG